MIRVEDPLMKTYVRMGSTHLDLHGSVECHVELVPAVLAEDALVALLEQRRCEGIAQDQMPAWR